MTARKLAPLLALASALLLSPTRQSRGAEASTRLFCIERSTNANVVCYDVRLRKDGSVDPNRPLDAYWIMRAEDSRREELSALERRLAYGFSVLGRATNDGFRFRMTSVPSRTIGVERVATGFRAATTVAAHPAQLVGLFVQTTQRLGLPKVDYVILRGVDLQDGTRREERLENR